MRVPRDLSGWSPARQWALLLAGGLAAGRALGVAHLPAAMMLGPMVLAAVMGMRGATVRPPRAMQVAAQAVIGTLIAASLQAPVLTRMVEMWPVVLLFVLLTLSIACAVGLAAARWTRLDREVTVWGFLPGMAGTMVALADERGIDARMVAFIQYQRLLMVILCMIAAGLALSGPSAPGTASPHAAGLASTAWVLALTAAGMAAARLLPGLPAGATLVPVALGGALSVRGVDIAAPPALIALAFLVIGAQIGIRFTPDLLRTGLRALPRLMMATTVLIGLCGLSGIVLSFVTGVDLLTACLATVPGSIDSLTLIALNTGSDVSFVMTLQTVRLFAVVLLGPAMARAMLRLVAGPARADA